MNIKVIEKQSNFISKILASLLESEDLPTWMIKNIQAFFMSSQMSLQRPEPKMCGTQEENGVSTPHVLSMRPYAYIRAKHANKGHLAKTCHFTPLKVSCIIKQVIQINQTCLLNQTNNTYPNIPEPIILFTTTLSSRNNITSMNKS